MKILVTGGAGFIGSHIVDYHMSQGDTVYVIDNLTSGQKSNIEPWISNENFHFIEANLLDCKELQQVLPCVERVYHFAAMVGMFRVLEAPVATLDVNLLSLRYILEIIKNQAQKPLVIVASSSEVYGNQKTTLPETTPLIIEDSSKSHAAYAISKMCNESMAIAYFQQYQIPCIVARIFNTIGPRQTGRYGMVVPRFVKQALNNEAITIFADGEQKRSFCDVRDLVGLIQGLCNNKRAIGQIINVGNKQTITIKKLAELIKSLIDNCSSQLTYKPYNEVYNQGYIVIKERIIDTEKLSSLSDYHPKYRLEDTINELIKSSESRP